MSEQPKCPEEGCKATRIYPEGTGVTLMGFSSYWESGQYHSHDPNTHTTRYRCGEGHSWSVRWKPPCPADDCEYAQ